MLKNIKLQLFADDDIEIDMPELELDDGTEIDIDDIEFDTEGEDRTSDIEEEKEIVEEEKERTVPLKALEAERRKYKEKIRKLEEERQQAQTKQLNTIEFNEKEELQKLFDKYTKAGYDEYTAERMAEDKLEDKKEMFELKKMLGDTGKNATKIKRDIEIENLSKDPFYSDIEDVREEVEKLSDKTGLSIKQAYNALYADSKVNVSKTDLRRQIENEILANKSKKASAKVDTTANGEVEAKPKVKLSSDEISIAKAAGMTPQEYYAMKQMSSTEQYKKYKNKKG